MATTTKLLKDPTLPIPGSPGSMIRFCHPGYIPRLGTLFSLPRVDKTRNTDRPLGVHHNTALLACQIVAGNETNGQLYSDRNGEHPVQVGLDEILDEDEYYFVVGGDPHLKYPVVPCFQDWLFPHGKMPDSWKSTESDLHSPGVRCALTSHILGYKRAHIVPKEKADWFEYNDMVKYTSGEGLNSDGNAIHLRADIHRGYDDLQFAIVPKKEIYGPENDTRSANYVVHVLGEGTGELWPLYHNVPLQNLDGTFREYHFARFAMAVFRGVKWHFILKGHPRKVMRIEGEEGPRTVDLSGAELKELYGGSGSRVASSTVSRKRRRVGEVDSEVSDDSSNDSFGTQTEGGSESEHWGRTLCKAGWESEKHSVPVVSTYDPLSS